MSKLGVRLQSGELRLVENLDSSDIKESFIVYEDEEDILCCSKITLLPATLVIERGNIKPVKFIREATNSDKAQLLNKKTEEKKAFNLCNARISGNDLPMRLIDAVYTFDFNRLTFFYSAESRVDFRKLLKDLTGLFRRTRILLRQIGAREEARLFNGVGTCGRTLCCSTWLVEFPFVTMKMAKNQNLPPNPSKLTGVCGKLKCCLSYEDEMYLEEKAKMPDIGTYVETGGGIAQVLKHYALVGGIQIKYYETGSYQDIKMADIKTLNVPSPEAFEADFAELDDL
jgi:cell fate regulator YaaT (PSP1 superfamily)